MNLEDKCIDPKKGKFILESLATLGVFTLALLTTNPIASAITIAIFFRIIWETWQEDKVVVCL